MGSSNASLPPVAQARHTGSEPSAGFTPGPWRAYSLPLVSHVFDAKGAPEGYRIADVHQFGPLTLSKATRQANARLIAAAPDLYEAVRAHLEARDTLRDVPTSRLSLDDPRFAAVTDTLEAMRAALSKAGA